MSDTNFVNGITLTDADWFNDVNRLHYTILGDPSNIAALRTTLAASDTVAGVIEVAVQSEIETAASVTLAMTPARMRFFPGVAKGWASVNAAGGINLDHNLDSVSDVGTGSVLFTWFIDFSDTNYGAIVSIEESGATILTAFVGAHTASTTQVTCVTNDASPVVADPDVYFIGVFGDQAA